MVAMKTTHRLSLNASGVLTIVTTMTCNGSAPGMTTTAYKKRGVAESRNNSCANPHAGGSARSESG
jgi:hypothetical protein